MPENTGKLIILTAPSGSGKTSITRYLLQQYPALAFSISATTRSPRSGETNGVAYYFISVEDFQQKIREDAFVEWEMVYEGKYYGTLKAELERIWAEQKVPVLDIDVKGALHVQQLYGDHCLSIFIQPPSIEELGKRLKSRGTETVEGLHTRLSKATYEMSFREEFHHTVLNDQLQQACTDTENLIKDFLGW
jgi:guanylate kinase